MANTRIYLKPTKTTLDGTELVVFEDAADPHTTRKQSIDQVVQQRATYLAPLTTKGDVLGFSTVPVRIPVGANGKVLIADSGESAGFKWGDAGVGSAAREAFRVTKAATQVVSTPGAAVKLEFDTVNFQTGVTYNTVSHTVSVDAAGPFGFMLKVPVTPPADGPINVNIYAYKDGVEIDKFTFNQRAGDPGGAPTIGYVFDLVPSNVIDFRIDYAGNDGNDIVLLGGTGGMTLHGFAVGVESGSFPSVAFSAYQTPQQAIPVNVATTVNFEQTYFNIGVAFASNIFTAPRDGYYLFVFKGQMVPPGGGATDVQFRLMKNGVTNLALDEQEVGLGEIGRPACLSAFVYLSATETVEATCGITGNGGASLDISNSPWITYFQGFLVASGDIRKTPVAVSGTTKTLGLSDAFTLQVCSNASAQTMTFPLDSTTDFPIGTQIDFAQYGAGQLGFSKEVGVTLNNKLGISNPKVVTQFAGASATKTGANAWWLVGDLAA